MIYEMNIDKRNKEFKKYKKRLILLYSQLFKEISKEIAGLRAGIKEWNYAELTKYNRLNKLNKKLKRIVREFSGNISKEMEKILMAEYKRMYKETKSVLKQEQKKVKLKTDKEIKQDIKKEWSGLNYEERLEKNNMLIAYKLKEQIVQSAVAEEDNIAELGDRLEDVEEYAGDMIDRLVESELDFVDYLAVLYVATEAGVAKLQYNTCHSPRTCVECVDLDGQVFKVGEEPSLPRHPHCGCYYELIIE